VLYLSNIAFYDPKRKIILKKGSSRACGINNRSISIHAENNAINYCLKKKLPKRCKIYIWRWSKSGEIKPARCCNACTILVNKYNFNDRIFTFNNYKEETALSDNPGISLGYKILHGF
jgi:hypothetical protein